MARAFVITGPSGVGKGSLIAELRRRIPELELSVSATTRPPRRGERDGVDYHFLGEEEFDRRIRSGDFLEWAAYSGHRYGTLWSEVERCIEQGRSVVLEIEVQGARAARKRLNEVFAIFIRPPSPEALRERLVARGTDAPEAIESRLAVAEQELEAESEFPRCVTNDDFGAAAAELTDIVRGVLGDEGAVNSEFS